MESIDTELAARIRQDIIMGVFKEDERLSEARLCEIYDVSRTPIRLALRLLEREKLIRRGEGRGYTVYVPTVEEILQAVQVRGHLESLAARLMAQSEHKAQHLPHMARAIETIDKTVRQADFGDAAKRQAQAANKVFHSTILNACGNEYVGFTCDQISHLPMLAVGSMVFDRTTSESSDQMERGLFRLHLGNAQHQVIFEAIEKGDAVRAEGMMREHSHTMVDYIRTFERKDDSLSVADLIAYSGAEPLTFGQ
ncbi:GntR family transcriptional regulator [Shimia abyssi]|uniref:GntR family transcriptional regulator n=1 Tax=Shimia abyssi TaxID=1662395 RepID=A0A2P8FDF6_9RHOB|nr:GntR family transcriptional regulator [Shimia abyssi]PSL19734.1 GntR family transcriptional regulator [Shimia abyssi]